MSCQWLPSRSVWQLFAPIALEGTSQLDETNLGRKPRYHEYHQVQTMNARRPRSPALDLECGVSGGAPNPFFTYYYYVDTRLRPTTPSAMEIGLQLWEQIKSVGILTPSRHLNHCHRSNHSGNGFFALPTRWNSTVIIGSGARLISIPPCGPRGSFTRKRVTKNFGEIFSRSLVFPVGGGAGRRTEAKNRYPVEINGNAKKPRMKSVDWLQIGIGKGNEYQMNILYMCACHLLLASVSSLDCWSLDLGSVWSISTCRKW